MTLEKEERDSANLDNALLTAHLSNSNPESEIALLTESHIVQRIGSDQRRDSSAPLSSTTHEQAENSSASSVRRPTTTFSAASSFLSPLSIHIQKPDIFLCHILLVVTSVATAVMNAAIAIFGMGVGVGLILGDTLRSNGRPSVVSASPQSMSQTAPSGASMAVGSAGPDYRADVQQQSHISQASATVGMRAEWRHRMPAQ